MTIQYQIRNGIKWVAHVNVRRFGELDQFKRFGSKLSENMLVRSTLHFYGRAQRKKFVRSVKEIIKNRKFSHGFVQSKK